MQGWNFHFWESGGALIDILTDPIGKKVQNKTTLDMVGVLTSSPRAWIKYKFALISALHPTAICK